MQEVELTNVETFFSLSELTGRGRYTLKVKPSRYHLTHLFKHDSHSFHSGVLGGYLAVNV